MSHHPLNIIEEDAKPWYAEGLPFKCTGCGQCCTGGPGYVWVSDDEIISMAATLKLTIDDFAVRYLRQVGQRYSLREDPRTFDCVFLENNRCSLYEHRPLQCRTFPWWVQNLRSKEDWDKAAVYCEGMNHPEAEIVSVDKIEKQLNKMKTES